MRSLKVKSTSKNQTVIGFVDPNANRIARVNNLRDKQFGASKDRKALNAACRRCCGGREWCEWRDYHVTAHSPILSPFLLRRFRRRDVEFTWARNP
jgi:hypothetical protein